MKKRILALGMVLALVAVMALPMAVFADTGNTGVTGTLASTFTLNVPSDITLGGGTLNIGANTGSAIAGSVITNVAGWTLSVSDTTSDFMEITTLVSGGTLGDPLDTPIQVGMASGSGTVAAYSAALQGTNIGLANGYGGTGTFPIPLYASQTVVGTDEAGVYSISLTYLATAGPD